MSHKPENISTLCVPQLSISMQKCCSINHAPLREAREKKEKRAFEAEAVAGASGMKTRGKPRQKSIKPGEGEIMASRE